MAAVPQRLQPCGTVVLGRAQKSEADAKPDIHQDAFAMLQRLHSCGTVVLGGAQKSEADTKPNIHQDAPAMLQCLHLCGTALSCYTYRGGHIGVVKVQED
eukprot:1138848-Pelagomonas_calceolata.AAC.11